MYRRVLPSFRARFFSTAEKQSTSTKAVKAPKVSAKAESESSTDVSLFANFPPYNIVPHIYYTEIFLFSLLLVGH